jgi:hypothetical protein
MSEMCANCGERPGTLQWVGEGGVMALVHGMYQMWCELCAARAQLDYSREQATRVADLEARVAELES